MKGVWADDLDVEAYRKDKILRGLVIQEIQNQHPTEFQPIDALFSPQIKDLEKKIKETSR
jgi:hypothetical protein